MQFQPMVILPDDKYKKRFVIAYILTALIAVLLCGVTISLPISLVCFGRSCDCPHDGTVSNKTATSLLSFFHHGTTTPKTTTTPPVAYQIVPNTDVLTSTLTYYLIVDLSAGTVTPKFCEVFCSADPKCILFAFHPASQAICFFFGTSGLHSLYPVPGFTTYVKHGYAYSTISISG